MKSHLSTIYVTTLVIAFDTFFLIHPITLGLQIRACPSSLLAIISVLNANAVQKIMAWCWTNRKRFVLFSEREEKAIVWATCGSLVVIEYYEVIWDVLLCLPSAFQSGPVSQWAWFEQLRLLPEWQTFGPCLPTLAACWATVGDGSPARSQRWNILQKCPPYSSSLTWGWCVLLKSTETAELSRATTS